MAAFKKFGTITIGFIIFMVGLTLLLLPGPGLVLMAAGLAILGRHFAWPRKLLAPMQHRINQLRNKNTAT